MKKIFLTLLVAMVSMIGYGQENAETIEVEESFRSVHFEGSMRVIINPIKENEKAHALISVKGAKIKEVKWEIRNDCLDVRIMQGILNEQAEIEIDLYINELRNIKIKGVDMVSSGTILSPDMMIETIGSENRVNLNIETKDLTVKASGNSDIKLSGQTEHAIVESRAGARVDMLHCPAAKITCTAAEGSEIYALADDMLSAKVSTNATLYYIGDPKETQFKTTLFGAIVSLDDVMDNAGKKL